YTADGVTMSMYEMMAGQPGGAARLASARLRRQVLILLWGVERKAIQTRRLRRALNGDGDLRTGTLAELLFHAGYELELRLVPAGEPGFEPDGDQPDELARAAYRAYGQTTGFRDQQNLPIPGWDDLDEATRDAWRAGARAVAEKAATDLRAKVDRVFDE
ncbi:MAG: hypothetical protein ABIS86_14580, partial [Streptosporangiaceae bacterium]